MRTAFADTAYFLALLNPRDELHTQALELKGSGLGPLVTSEFVLMEVGDGLSQPANRPLFARLRELLSGQSDVAIAPASSALFKKACELHANRPDKDWSLTDCTSFVIMAEKGITDALTSDHHFQQAGFKALMLP